MIKVGESVICRVIVHATHAIAVRACTKWTFAPPAARLKNTWLHLILTRATTYRILVEALPCQRSAFGPSFSLSGSVILLS